MVRGIGGCGREVSEGIRVIGENERGTLKMDKSMCLSSLPGVEDRREIRALETEVLHIQSGRSAV